MSQDKSLKDFMIDSHIPRRWRDNIPVVEAGGRIAWVVGWNIADWAKVRNSTRRILEIIFTPSEG
jgi:tRNA(Ile)-lysidine synthase